MTWECESHHCHAAGGLRCDHGICDGCLRWHSEQARKHEAKKDPLNPWGCCEDFKLGNTIGGYYCANCWEPQSLHVDLQQKREIARLRARIALCDKWWTGCRKCGKPVEDERICYAEPTCYACLPPPPPIEPLVKT